MTQNLIRQILTLVAIFAAFGINILANVRPINNLTLGEISNQLFENVLITPASYAFAIWGLIYLGLFSLAIYQMLPSQREKPLFSQQISYGLVMASIAQIAWVFLFQLRFFVVSFLAMLLILIPLTLIYARLQQIQRPFSWRERWFVQNPISIYFAWISVATILNGAVSLTAMGWGGWGMSPVMWTVIMLLVGGLIAGGISFKTRDVAFTGVYLWALVAIAIRHFQDSLSITATALGVALVIAVLTLFSPIRGERIEKN